MIGLAQKAGKVSSGDYSSEMIIKSQKCSLVVIAQDASDRTKKKFRNMCVYRNIKLFEYGSKEKLGKCIGKNDRSIITINDNNFATSIESLITKIINGGEPIAKKST